MRMPTLLPFGKADQEAYTSASGRIDQCDQPDHPRMGTLLLSLPGQDTLVLPVVRSRHCLQNFAHRQPDQIHPVLSGQLRPPGRVFAVASPVAGAAAAVTMLSDFSSSGLKTNNLSCGVSMACTQTCRLTPISP